MLEEGIETFLTENVNDFESVEGIAELGSEWPDRGQEAEQKNAHE